MTEAPKDLTILGTGVGAVVSVALTESSFSTWHTIVGIILFLVLIPYWKTPSSSHASHIAYFAVLAFSLLIALGWPLSELLPIGNWEQDDKCLGQKPIDVQLFMVWFFLWIALIVSRRYHA